MNGDFENVLDGDYTEKTGMWYFQKPLKVVVQVIFFFIGHGPGHGEEYYYEDDGTWTSLCLALPRPDPNVRFI